MNSAEKETQAILSKMETEVTAQYQKAVDEIAEKIEKFYKAYETKEAKWQEMVNSGVKTEKEFKAWRQNQYAVGKRWEQMKETLSNDLYNSNKIARSIVNGYTPDVYATNFNYATYQIEKGAQINTQFTLYNHEAVERLLRDNPDLLPISTLNELKDKAYNRKLLQSVAIQGILQGESIPKLAKRVADTCGERNRKAAIRNARTIVTSAQNGGRVDAFKRAQDLGVDMMQEWRAVFDNRTRHSHRQLDGERRKVGEPFSNGLLYPADPNGAPEEVYNCRCNIKGVVNGLEPRAIKYRSDEAVGVSYEEWKKGKTRPQMRPKDQPKHKPLKPHETTKDNRTANKVYEERLRNKIYETYDKHIDINNLQLLKTADFIEEKSKKDFSGFNAYWGNLGNETVKPFTEQLIKLMNEYDTPLYNIRLFDKMDMLGQKDAFAYVFHDYRLDRAEMRINPVKCSGDKLISRLKELKEQHYIPQIKDGTESIYIATHEFGHTLLELTEKFPNKQNWAGADFKHLQNVRKDIYSVHNEYLKELEKAEKRWKDEELKFLNGDMTKEVVENAIKYRQEYDEMFISKYALTNENEFLAECFASAILSEKPNKYALKIKKILDDNFKRKK